ncbi:MAG: Ig-like domain-containing protein, partial [Nitrospirae bacterium]|nr:Ig-like domain-containing protein [Nitrospirota bacterium]
ISLGAALPRVVSIDPEDGRENVPLSGAIKIRFSEPIEAGTVNSSNIALTGPTGNVAGALSLGLNNTTVTFRPTELLTANSLYTVTISQGIQDLSGYGMASPFTSKFTSLDTEPPLPPPAGNVTATIPGTDGKTTITATQGTADVHDTVWIVNTTKGTSVPVLVDPDGSFTASIVAGITDKIQIKLTDPAGNETLVPIGLFRNPDGSVAVGPDGGQIFGADGLIIYVPTGAFPEGSIVKVTSLTEAGIGLTPFTMYPFVAGFDLESTAVPQKYLNMSVPLPSGADSDSTGIVAQVIHFMGSPALSMVDTAKVIDGRLTTSSPPCPGILDKYARYAVFLNSDQQMRLGISILSMAAPRTRTYVVQPFIPDTFISVPHLDMIAQLLASPLFPELGHARVEQTTYYPASPFIAAIHGGADPDTVLFYASLGPAGCATLSSPEKETCEYFNSEGGICFAMPPDKPVQVVVRDVKTGQITQVINTTTPPAGQSRNITAQFIVPGDIESPKVAWTSWSKNAQNILDTNKEIIIVFSEPVRLADDDPSSGTGPVYLLEDAAASPMEIKGRATLYNNNRMLLFSPERAIPLGKTFFVMMGMDGVSDNEGVQDLAGNFYRNPATGPLKFTTFQPSVILPTLDHNFDIDKLESDLGVAPGSVNTAALRDLDFSTTTPWESTDGKWHTELTAIGERMRQYGWYQVLTMDLSDTLNPRVLRGYPGATQSPYGFTFLNDYFLETRADLLAGTNLMTWAGREMHYLEEDPQIRLCIDPGNADDRTRFAAWQTRYNLSPVTLKVKRGGCGDLALITAFNQYYSTFRMFDVTGSFLASPLDIQWIGYRLLSDNGLMFGFPRKNWAPGGSGYAKGIAILPDIDMPHDRKGMAPSVELHKGTSGAYVAVTGIGLELVDTGLNIPEILDSERGPGDWYDPATGLPNWPKFENLGLFSGPYYNDVEVVGADKTPPEISITAPEEALPGSQVIVRVNAADETAVSSVTFYLDDAENDISVMLINSAEPFVVADPPYQRVINIPWTVTSLPVIHIRVAARDISGNSTESEVAIPILKYPDTVKPSVSITVPREIMPGRFISLSANAADNVAVKQVNFYAPDRTLIVSDNAKPFEARYFIPAGSPAGSVMTFSAEAVDTSGNTEMASADLLIGTNPDRTHPSVKLSGPPVVVSGRKLYLSADASDNVGISSVIFSVDGAVINTDDEAPYQAEYPVPPNTTSGTMLRIEARAIDFTSLDTVDSGTVGVVNPPLPGHGLMVGEPRIVVVAADTTDGSGVKTLEVFRSDLSGVNNGIVQLPLIAKRVAVSEGLIEYDGNGDGIDEPHDIAFITGSTDQNTGMAVVEIPREIATISGSGLSIYGIYAMPMRTVTRHVEIDNKSKTAYVSAEWPDSSGAIIGGILVIDVTNPFGPYQDRDGDKWDDRIIGKIPVTSDLLLWAGVWGFRLDTKRKLIYAAIGGMTSSNKSAGLAVIKMCDCPELTADIKLLSGSIERQYRSGATDSKDFVSTDGEQDIILVTPPPADDPLAMGTVCANLDVRTTPGVTINYSLTESPFSGNPGDAMLDMSSGSTGLLILSNPSICMNLTPRTDLPAGSYLNIELTDSLGVVIKRLQVVLVPVRIVAGDVKIKTDVDSINRNVCSSDDYLEFAISRDAEVTIRIDGSVVMQDIGGQRKPFQDINLPAGRNQILITKDMVPEPGEHDFEITAIFSRNPGIKVTKTGQILHEVTIREFLPVGHTIVGGIDLYNGHVVAQREDISIPGIGHPLQFIRSYGSVGNDASGPMGAGWTHNYLSRLVTDGCGVVNLIGGEGSGMKFSTPVFDRDPLGRPIMRYKPLQGYHGELIYNVVDDSYEFYTKARTHYHYQGFTPPFGSLSGKDYRLGFIEDTYQNRLNFTYSPLSPYYLEQVTDFAGRGLKFYYASSTTTPTGTIHFGSIPENRLIKVEVVDPSGPLGLVIDYDYDRYGNLISVTREDMVEQYDYTTGDARDRHNLKTITDPVSNVTEYVYYANQDIFPGEDSTKLYLPLKYELVKQLIKGAGTPDASIAGFTYDYSNHQTEVVTTIEDPKTGRTTHHLSPLGNVKKVVDAMDYTTETCWAYEICWSGDSVIQDVYVKSEKEPNGRETRFFYDGNANLIREEIHFSGMTAGYEPVLDRNGRPVSTVVTRSTYDPVFGKLTQKIDPEGTVTDYEIDPANGAIKSVTTYPAPGQTSKTLYAYYPNGLLKSMTDPKNNTANYDYDAYGNLKKVRDAAGNEATVSYDILGRLRGTSDTMGRSSTIDYDGFWKDISSATRHSGASSSDDTVVSIDYYPDRTKKSQTDSLGHQTEFYYDALVRLSRQVEHLADADGNAVTYETTYTYDLANNTITVKDPRNVETTSQYDLLDRLSDVYLSGPFGSTVHLNHYDYDRVGNKFSETSITGGVTAYTSDGLYRVIRTTLPVSSGSGTPYTMEVGYDLTGNRLWETDANGKKYQYEYDGVYRLIKKTDPLGKEIRYVYDANGNIETETHPTTGLVISSTFDLVNRIMTQTKTFTDPLTASTAAYTTTFAYDDSRHIRVTTDPEGKKKEEVYDGLDHLISVTRDPGGLNISSLFEYNGNGNLKKATDPEGRAVSHTFDGLGRKIRSIYNPQGFEEKFYFDGAGNLIKDIDRRGIVLEYGYDNLNRRLNLKLHETLTGGGSIVTLKEFVYEDITPDGPKMTEVDPYGNRIIQTYDLMGREIRITEPVPFGRNITYEYDGINTTASIDQKNNRTEFRYDDLNRLTQVVDPYGNITETTYLDNLNQRILTDKKGVPEKYQYDPLMRLRQSFRSLSSNNSFDIIAETNLFRGDNALVATTDAVGNVTRYEYDAAGRLVEEIHGYGTADQAATLYTHDKVDRIKTVKDARGHGGAFDMSYEYDDTNSKVISVDADGNTTVVTYDGERNMISKKEPNGGIWSYAYDETGELLTVTDPLNGLTTYAYDVNRNMVEQVDAGGGRTTFAYDSLYRLIDVYQEGDGGSTMHTRYGYDETGNLSLSEDNKGQRIDLGYDHLNRLVSKSYSNHADPIFPYPLSIDYGYDANNNLLTVRETKRFGPGDDRVEAMVSVYDNLNRLLSRNNPDGKVISYAYYDNGNRRSLTDPEGVMTSYSYDPLNRLRTVINNDGQTAYTFYQDGLLNTIAYPNQTGAEIEYGRSSRATRIKYTRRLPGPDGLTGTTDDISVQTSSREYGYDANGNILAENLYGANPAGSPETTRYSYDDVDRMTRVQYPSGASIDYTYDAVGNRISENGVDPLDGVSPIQRSYTYNAFNQLVTVADVINPGKNIAFEYDLNGNLTRRTTAGISIDYTYDIRDQLARVADSSTGTLSVYDYDYNRMRVKKMAGGSETRYLYDGSSLIMEYEGALGNAALVRYNYGMGIRGDGLLSLNDLMAGSSNPMQIQYYASDILGSVTNTTDGNGDLHASYRYDAWGNIISSTGASVNSKTFTGHYLDRETGLYYFGARYYDPTLGRFISQDPLMGSPNAPQSLHRYLYANDNPVRFTDLEGYYSYDQFKDDVENIKKTAKDMKKDMDKLSKAMGKAYMKRKADIAFMALKFLMSPDMREQVEASELNRGHAVLGRDVMATLKGVDIKKVVKEGAKDLITLKAPREFIKSIWTANPDYDQVAEKLLDTIDTVVMVHTLATVSKAVLTASFKTVAKVANLRATSRTVVSESAALGRATRVSAARDILIKEMKEVKEYFGRVEKNRFQFNVSDKSGMLKAASAIRAEEFARSGRSITPTMIAEESLVIRKESVLRTLDIIATPEAKMTADLIRSGDVDFKLTVLKSEDLGYNPFGSRDIYVNPDLIGYGNLERAAAVAGHEAWHVQQQFTLKTLSSQSYRQVHEIEAIIFESRIFPGSVGKDVGIKGRFPNVQDIESFVRKAYKGVPK